MIPLFPPDRELKHVGSPCCTRADRRLYGSSNVLSPQDTFTESNPRESTQRRPICVFGKISEMEVVSLWSLLSSVVWKRPFKDTWFILRSTIPKLSFILRGERDVLQWPTPSVCWSDVPTSYLFTILCLDALPPPGLLHTPLPSPVPTKRPTCLWIG